MWCETHPNSIPFVSGLVYNSLISTKGYEMPNWVSNSVTIEGKPELVNQIKELVAKPYIMPVQSNGDLAYTVKDVPVDSPFSFWNVIKPTDMEAYPKQPNYTLDKPYAGDDWYSWNNRNWGVKWDATNPELVYDEPNGENHVLVYNFETAWGMPSPVLIELSRQFPSVLITNEYMEETGWGGEAEYANGKELSESEYNWKCWECGYKELGEPPYCEDCEFDMCPKCGHGEPTDEDRATCQTHGVESNSNEGE